MGTSPPCHRFPSTPGSRLAHLAWVGQAWRFSCARPTSWPLSCLASASGGACEACSGSSPPESANLLDMRFVGFSGPSFEAQRVKVKTSGVKLPKELFEGDPLAVTPFRPSFAFDTQPDSGDIDFDSNSGDEVVAAADGDDDGGDFDESDEDPEGIIGEELEEVPPLAPPAEVTGLASAADQSVDEDAEQLLQALQADDEGAEEAAPSNTQLDVAVAACSISATGHISCTKAPWRERASLGRLTTWPASLPEDQRSISLRCTAHSRCSVAKKRKVVSDSLLIRWLLQGKRPPPLASCAEKDRSRDEHMALFRQMFADEQQRRG